MLAAFSSGCSETWAWSGTSRSPAQAATAAASAGATARTLWIAAPIRTPAPLAAPPVRSASTRSAQRSAVPSEKRRCPSLSSAPIPPCR